MRSTTITTIASIAIAIALTPKAIAQPNPEFLTPRQEDSKVRPSVTPPSYESEDRSLTGDISEKQDLRDYMIPESKTVRTSGKPSRNRLFTKPFYPSAARRQYEEKTIAQGSRGREVWILQRRLRARGFDPGSIDSTFGARTKKALQAFQKSRGLTANGVVDESTWRALAQKPNSVSQQPQHETLAKGSKGSKVKTLQRRLEVRGLEPGPVDGVFGRRTMAAVKKFQEEQGLIATGIVDEPTWRALGQ